MNSDFPRSKFWLLYFFRRVYDGRGAVYPEGDSKGCMGEGSTRLCKCSLSSAMSQHGLSTCRHGQGKNNEIKKGLHGPFERSLTCLTFLFLISFVLSFTVFSFTDPKRDLKGTQPWHIRQERHLWLTTTFGTSAAVDRLWLLV